MRALRTKSRLLFGVYFSRSILAAALVTATTLTLFAQSSTQSSNRIDRVLRKEAPRYCGDSRSGRSRHISRCVRKAGKDSENGGQTSRMIMLFGSCWIKDGLVSPSCMVLESLLIAFKRSRRSSSYLF